MITIPKSSLEIRLLQIPALLNCRAKGGCVLLDQYSLISVNGIFKNIMQTCPCNVHPLTPHFYIVKLGFTGVYIFLIFAPKHRLWVHVTEAVLTCTHN